MYHLRRSATAIVRWPGQGEGWHRQRRDIFRHRLATDLGILGRRGGASARRPPDRRDRWLAFLARSSTTTVRDHVIYYGSDAQLMSVKWKTMKIVFRFSESTSYPIVKPQWPLIFDLIDDPREEWDLIEKRLDCGWV